MSLYPAAMEDAFISSVKQNLPQINMKILS